MSAPSISPRAYAPAPPSRLAFIGLGTMGYPMAGHLARAGHHVTVYNRTASKADAWLAEFTAGSTGTQQLALAPTPHAAAAGADVVFCCVGNDADLRAVATGDGDSGDGGQRDFAAFAGMKPGALFVDHTTASATVARELAAVAGARGLRFVDAPVSGGQGGAQAGMLTVMCGGAQHDVDAMQPLAMHFARACTRMGDSGAGQLTKMVNQICIAGVVQGLSEAVAFGQRAGLDMVQALDVIGKGAAQSWQMDNRGRTMVEDRFDFGFAVDWMRKDLAMVLDEARRNGARLPLTALVDQFYADLQEMGGSRQDTSSLVRRLR